jgi:glycosyltransferase involved in cell wall biosynthesis
VTTVQYTDHEPADTTTYSRKRHLLDAITVRLGADEVIAVSEAVRRSTRQRLGVRRIALVPNAVDLERFARANAVDRTRLRAELGVGAGEMLLLAVGRLHPQKGHRYAILALRSLLDAEVPARLAVVGQGPLAAELQALADAEGVGERFRLLGVRDDVPELLQACDVFVFPSLGEGLPVALIEAMAAGRACVASNIPAIAELVEDDRTGLLVTPGDVRGLTAALLTLWRDQSRAATLGMAARAHVMARYDAEVVVRRLERLYETSLVRRGFVPPQER